MINPEHTHGIYYLIPDEAHINLSGSPASLLFLYSILKFREKNGKLIHLL